MFRRGACTRAQETPANADGGRVVSRIPGFVLKQNVCDFGQEHWRGEPEARRTPTNEHHDEDDDCLVLMDFAEGIARRQFREEGEVAVARQ